MALGITATVKFGLWLWVKNYKFELSNPEDRFAVVVYYHKKSIPWIT